MDYGEVIAESSQNISVVKQGSYHVDLILFPVIESIINESDFEINGFIEEKPDYTWLYVFGALVIIGFILFLISLLIKKKKKHEIKTIKDDQKIIDYIKKHKRVTQKQLRHEFALSESYTSMLITDLEKQGRVRKIKKGRGNIVVWNE